MNASKLIRELTEKRDAAAAKAVEGNRLLHICIDGPYFCISNRAGDSCCGMLARKEIDGLHQIGSFSLLQTCEGFYCADLLVTLRDDSFLDQFSHSNLNGLLNRLRLQLGISGVGPTRAVCVVGGISHYSMTEADPNLMRTKRAEQGGGGNSASLRATP